jgi:eukaryotic-like serine/threonine-protein kinase
MQNEQQIEDFNAITGVQTHTSSVHSKKAKSLLRELIPRGESANMVVGRYAIDVDNKLEKYNNVFVHSVACNDIAGNETNIYALVLNSHFPVREEIFKLAGKEIIKNFILPIASEVIPVGSNGSCNVVSIMRHPYGISLYEFIEKYGKQSEKFILEIFLPKMAKLLYSLEVLGVVHGNLNPHNIFIDIEDGHEIYLDGFLLGYEGFEQSQIYLPLEQLTTNHFGRANANKAVDCYALGVTTLFLFLGHDLMQDMDDDIQNDYRYRRGTPAIVPQHEINSNILKSVIKGLLSDNNIERWDSKKIIEALLGKRIPLAKACIYSDSSRPFEFLENKYYNVASLAFSMWVNWNYAKAAAGDEQIIKWIDRGIGEPRIADQLEYLKKMATYSRGELAIDEDQFLSRAILILDHNSPIRYISIAATIESLGKMLAALIATQDSNNLLHLIKIIQLNIAFLVYNDWEEVTKIERQSFIKLLEKASIFISQNKLGFGLERCLYEFNPKLCLQSPNLLKYYITNLRQLFDVIENEDNIDGEDFIYDKHIHGFIAFHVNLLSEVNLKHLSRMPEFENNQILRILYLFSYAQRACNIKLPKLTSILRDALSEVVDMFSSKENRDNINNELDKSLEYGDLTTILNIITNIKTIRKDKAGFIAAQRMYVQIEREITNLGNEKKFFEVGYYYGLKICIVISYLICSIVMIKYLAVNL